MTTEERAREAIEHLQHAALEMISAARAVLDVAEELVKDPSSVATFAATVAQAAAQAGADVPTPEPRVQHIRVS